MSPSRPSGEETQPQREKERERAHKGDSRRRPGKVENGDRLTVKLVYEWVKEQMDERRETWGQYFLADRRAEYSPQAGEHRKDASKSQCTLHQAVCRFSHKLNATEVWPFEFSAQANFALRRTITTWHISCCLLWMNCSLKKEKLRKWSF